MTSRNKVHLSRLTSRNVCLECAAPGVCIMPCTHFSLCVDCVQSSEQCPRCFTPISGWATVDIWYFVELELFLFVVFACLNIDVLVRRLFDVKYHVLYLYVCDVDLNIVTSIKVERTKLDLLALFHVCPYCFFKTCLETRHEIL